MPTQNLGKAEKKDNRQLLLDLISKQYGTSNAVVMEKALKTQDKQIEEAMGRGMTAEQIGQSKGIDLNLLDRLLKEGNVKAQGESQPQDQQSGIQTKPASSPFGFGGATMENGQIVEQKPGIVGGIIASLLGNSPTASAERDLRKLLEISKIQRQQQLGQEKGFYQFNPMTGELEQVSTLPKGAEVRNVQVSPQERAEAYGKVSKDVAKYKTEIARESPERVQMASNLDQMDVLLTDMEQYISKDPMAFVKGINPLAEREFKAILQNFDKTAAIAAGGKQLTKTELDLIRNTRPTLLDTKNPEAIQYKFNILRNTLALARERLNRGVKTENKSQDGDNGTLQRLGLDPNKYEIVR